MTEVQGSIEAVQADRIVRGWAHAGPCEPCHVQVLDGGRVVAETCAMEFRADLLRGGIGHGHHGFSAVLDRQLDPGVRCLHLFAPCQGVMIGAASGWMLDVPRVRQGAAVSAAALLKRGARWRDTDIISNPGCFRLDADMARLGIERFVAAVFLYVLQRPVDEDGLRFYTDRLSSGLFTPERFFMDVLRSDERRRMTSPLLSPFEDGFPFRL